MAQNLLASVPVPYLDSAEEVALSPARTDHRFLAHEYFICKQMYCCVTRSTCKLQRRVPTRIEPSFAGCSSSRTVWRGTSN